MLLSKQGVFPWSLFLSENFVLSSRMTSQSQEDYDCYFTSLATPRGAPKDSPEAQNTPSGVFQLPDDLLCIPNYADDDLISVLFRDIQASNFGSLIGDVPSIYDFLDSEFNLEFNVHHTPNSGEEEIIDPVPSPMIPTTTTDGNGSGYSSSPAYQLPVAAFDGTWSTSTIQSAVSDGAVGHQAQSSPFYSVTSDEGRMECGLAGTSVPTEPPRHREISPPLSRPQTRRSNQRAIDLCSAAHLSQLPFCPDYSRISTVQNVDTSGMGAQSLTNVHDECGSVNEHPLSQTHERMDIPNTLTSKPRIWLKPRLIRAPVGCEVADATSLQSPPQPVEYHLRPIRGRPRGSKTGGGKQNVSSIRNVVSGLIRLSESSTQATPLEPVDYTTEKPKKTRAKHKNVAQPNPYPDLSKYRSSDEQSTCIDNVITHSQTTSPNSVDSVVNTTFIHSIGSPPMTHYPLSVSDDPAFFVLTNAEWNRDNVSRPSGTRSYTQTHFYNGNDDHTLHPRDETAATDKSVIYPAPMPPDISSTSSTGPTGALRQKRKRDADDNELYEMGTSLKRRSVKTSGSSPSELCDHRAGVISSTPALGMYEYANPSGDGLADTHRTTGENFATTGSATLSAVIEDGATTRLSDLPADRTSDECTRRSFHPIEGPYHTRHFK